MEILLVLGIFFVGFMVGIVCCAVYQVREDRWRRDQAMQRFREEWDEGKP